MSGARAGRAPCGAFPRVVKASALNMRRLVQRLKEI